MKRIMSAKGGSASGRKTIQMVDLAAQYKSIKPEIDSAIKNVIKDGGFVGGKYVQEFETSFAKYCGTKYANGLNSGTDSLYLALWALGIKEGDEVITTAFSFFATSEMISRIGATPVFVDIDPNSFNINPDLIEAKITKKTKAIIPVYLYGMPADMKKIMRIAKKYKLAVIEDACQAVGALSNGKRVGSIGDFGCFSFYPSKNLGAYGDGGMLVSNDAKLAEKVRMLHNHGAKVKYYHEMQGISSRLDGIQAAILNAKLRHLEKWSKARFKIAALYNKLLKDIDFIELSNFTFDKANTHIYHQYTLRVKKGLREKLAEYLNSKGVSTMVYYPVPLHLVAANKYLGYKKGDLPEAEKASQEVLSLPIYPELKIEKIEYICKLIKDFQN